MSSNVSSVAVSVELPSMTSQSSVSASASKKKKRLVHCSDGVLEVTDESESESATDSETESDAQDAPTPSSAPDGSTLGLSASSTPQVTSASIASRLSSSGGSSASLSNNRMRASQRSRRWSTYPERISCQPEWLAKTNPHALRWKSWFWYYTVFGASKSYDAANWAGEKLAWFFGITTPKVRILDTNVVLFTLPLA